MKFKLNEAFSILKRTPSILNVFLRDLDSVWIHKNEGGNTWSAFGIVGHLIHGEKTDWIERTKIILQKDLTKKFEPFDRFAQFKNSEGKGLEHLLDEFELLRSKNLKELSSLDISDDDLSLKGMHPELGSVTLSELLSAWVTHDLGHIAQISRVLAKQYKNEVGPWTAYIPILN